MEKKLFNKTLAVLTLAVTFGSPFLGLLNEAEAAAPRRSPSRIERRNPGPGRIHRPAPRPRLVPRPGPEPHRHRPGPHRHHVHRASNSVVIGTILGSILGAVIANNNR